MRVIRSRLFRFILLIVSLGVMVTAPGTILTLWHRRDVVGEREARQAALAREVEALQKELADAQTPEYIERVAREKLGLVKEGESIILMPPRIDSGQASVTTPDDSLPKWKQWWKLFF